MRIQEALMIVNNAETAAAILRAARAHAGLTQQSLADRLRVGQQSVARHEKAETLPKVDVWVETLGALSCAVSVALSGRERVIREGAEVTDAVYASRIAAGRYQREVAEEAGMTRAQVGRYENGEMEPGLSAALRLLEAVGLEMVIRPKGGAL